MHRKVDLQTRSLSTSLAEISSVTWDAVAISSWFSADDLMNPPAGQRILGDTAKSMLKTCADSLAMGGLLFIYGAPRRLPVYAEVLDSLGDGDWKLEFKYWIGVKLNESDKRPALNPAHIGILLYHKVDHNGKSHFDLDNSIKVPHAYCPACGQNIRDWGGKKHLCNPKGTALSDVWTDLRARRIMGNRMPAEVFERIKALAGGDNKNILHVVEGDEFPARRFPALCDTPTESQRVLSFTPVLPYAESESLGKLALDSVETVDCVKYMEALLPEYEDNAFDLVFADPPYNLNKMYENYNDDHAKEQYLGWCDRWLEQCARLLKPGGSLFVVNLPEWALHHSRTLDKFLQFRHWIVWQALAEPRGKLLPAHYAILYYTKPGNAPVVNYQSDLTMASVGSIDSPEYCLRASCIKKRKAIGDDRKVSLTDIWSDIHRIRHKRDRDYHPCQLPEKLMERIITLASNPGDVVFDPLCGVGTTALVAKKLSRHYVATDIDSIYVGITREKLEVMEDHRQEFGECIVPRKSITRQRRGITKKEIEAFVQQLAIKLGRVPEMEDVREVNQRMYEAIQSIYTSPRLALKAAKIVLGASIIKPMQGELFLHDGGEKEIEE